MVQDMGTNHRDMRTAAWPLLRKGFRFRFFCILTFLSCMPPLLLHLVPRGRRLAVEAIDPAFGYSSGRACHSAPTDHPPESRPAPCVGIAGDVDASEASASALRASVVLITHNEAGCAIRRTVLAILGPRTAPAGLLAEVLVMDDSSAPPAETAVRAAGGLGHVPQKADAALLPQVRWLRSEARLGVARARVAAARVAVAAVLVFLDAHCEPQTGWLPPLLALLARWPTAVALPVIELLDTRSWQYLPGPRPERPPRGVLTDWNLTSFGWRPLSDAEAAARDASPLGVREPLPSPLMAGGIFAITSKWFFGSGAYDEWLDTWGVENVEMALRMWTCGEGLYTLPCSRVAHAFRHAQVSCADRTTTSCLAARVACPQ